MSDVITIIHHTGTRGAEQSLPYRNVLGRESEKPGAPSMEMTPLNSCAPSPYKPMKTDQGHSAPLQSNDEDQQTAKFNQQGFTTKRDWIRLYCPGDVVVTTSHNHCDAFSVKSCSSVDAEHLRLECWSWAFNGKFYRESQVITLSWPSAAGSVKITELQYYPLQFDETGLEKTLRSRGHVFWSCRTRRHVGYDAPLETLDEIERRDVGCPRF